MIKALWLIFWPVSGWGRIVEAKRSIGFILATNTLPLLLGSALVEGWGMATWGDYRGQVAFLRKFPVGEVFVYQAVQVLLSLGLVFLGAFVAKRMGDTFHGRHSYTQAFRLVAYGLSPLFILRVLDAFPALSPWLTWSVGIFLTLSLLYSGVPLVMDPDPPHAFGLFMMSGLMLLFMSALLRFLSAWYLKGKFEGLERAVADLAARLPF
jgi:hypothetical protein